jgi:hypothetical protein
LNAGCHSPYPAGELVVEVQVPRGNEQKEPNDSEIISDREVWSAIRYLDPESESDRRKSDIAVVVAVFAVVCMYCVIIVYLHEL